MNEHVVIREVLQTIDRNIHHFIEKKRHNKFVIYTNGMGGGLVKEYLKSEFSIFPEYTIDNKKYNGIDILSIDQAKKRNNENVYFLICSWHNDLYEQIRLPIYNTFPKEQIIDVFPRIAESLPTSSEILYYLRKIDTFVEKYI